MKNNPQIILKNRYQVVPRTLILVFDRDRVLLQKGAQNKKIWAGYFNGSGGHIEKGEDVVSAARRELREEAGIECLDLHLVGTILIDVEDFNGIALFVFAGNYIMGNVHESDEGSLHWVKIQDIPDLQVVEDIAEIIERINNLQKGQLFHAHYGYDMNGKRLTTLG